MNSGITEKKSGNHFIPTLFYTLRAVKEERESMIKIVGTWERTDKEVDRHWNVLATLEHDLVTEDFSYTGGEYICMGETGTGRLHGRDWDWLNPRWLPWKRFGRELVFENTMLSMWVALNICFMPINWISDNTRFFFRRTAQIFLEITLVMTTRGAKKNLKK